MPAGGAPLVKSGPFEVGVTLTVPEDAPVPCVFVAATEQVYTVPLVSPVTVIGLPEPLPVIAPGLQVTV